MRPDGCILGIDDEWISYGRMHDGWRSWKGWYCASRNWSVCKCGRQDFFVRQHRRLHTSTSLHRSSLDDVLKMVELDGYCAWRIGLEMRVASMVLFTTASAYFDSIISEIVGQQGRVKYNNEMKIGSQTLSLAPSHNVHWYSAYKNGFQDVMIYRT